MCPMTLKRNMNIYNIRETQVPLNKHISLNNSIQIYYLNFEPVSTIHTYKEETKMKITSSHSSMHVHEVSERHKTTS